MKFTAAFSALVLSGITSAQDVQSKPFTLTVSSSGKYNGKALSSCHSGATIESLCIADTSSNFYFNTTTGSTSPIKGYTASGTLVYNLPLGGSGQPDSESQGMSFYVDPATNVALPLLEPGYGDQQVAFKSSDNSLVIFSNLDDTVSPPTGDKIKALNNWYICDTYFSSYTYTTLAWTLGTGQPQNPSCEKVNVIRKDA